MNATACFRSLSSSSLHDLKIPVSKTALWVAHIRGLEAARKDAIVNDKLAGLLAGQEGEEATKLFQEGLKGTKYMPAEKYISYQNTYLAVRQRIFDDFALEKLNKISSGNDEEKQLVILGSGLDTRAYRLKFPANTKVYEVDRAEIHDWKNKRLRQLQATSPQEVQLQADRRCVSTDFISSNWEQELIQAGFKPNIPSLFLAEGLLIYLSAPHAKELVTRAGHIATVGSHFGADYWNKACLRMTPPDRLALMEKIGCPFISYSDFPEDFLTSSGWTKALVKQNGDVTYGRYKAFVMPRWLFPLSMPRFWWMFGAKELE